MEIDLMRVKISKLTKDEYTKIKDFEQLIENKIDECDKGTSLYNYFLQMADCSSRIKDYSK